MVYKSSEIFELLFSDRPETDRILLSGALHRGIKTGTLKSCAPKKGSGKGDLFGLPEWFEGDVINSRYLPVKYKNQNEYV